MAIVSKLRADNSPRSATCQHRWLIETPNGVTAFGWCRRCGAERNFPTALEFELSNRHISGGRTPSQTRPSAD